MSGKCAKVRQSSKYSSTLLMSTTRFIKISHYTSFVAARLRSDRRISSCATVFLVISQLPVSSRNLLWKRKRKPSPSSTYTLFNQLLPPRNTKKDDLLLQFMSGKCFNRLKHSGKGQRFIRQGFGCWFYINARGEQISHLSK